ncbi:serine/threonine-protein kinase NLK [Arapaima gigas]
MGFYAEMHHLSHQQPRYNPYQAPRQLQGVLPGSSCRFQPAGGEGAGLLQPYCPVPSAPAAPAIDATSPDPLKQEDVGDQPIGCGMYGVVWAVTDPRDGKRVALKKMPKVFQTLSSCKQFLRELQVLIFCKHDNLLSILDVVQPPHVDYFEEIYLVTELMQSNLHSVIYSPQVLTSDHVKVFMYQILRGVKYLHSAGILHRDLKPGNLLVNSNCFLKICDFGMARAEEPDELAHMTQEVATLYYRAPELLMGARHHSSAVDMWSLGCIFGELLGRRFLFEGKTPIQQLDRITDLMGTPSEEAMQMACEGAKAHILKGPKKKPAILKLYAMSSGVSRSAIEFLSVLLELDPAKRISAHNALSHIYLREGRLRYHTSLCTCCSPFNTPAYAAEFEPIAPCKFEDAYEKNLTSFQKAKETIHRILQEHQKDRENPLCINPLSGVFNSFIRIHPGMKRRGAHRHLFDPQE